MKTFNSQAAINGKPVITRAGDSLTFGAYIPKANSHKLFMLSPDGDVFQYNENGRYIGNERESNMDIFMAPIKRTVWVNLYEDGSAYWHSTEYAAKCRAISKKLVARVCPVEIEG